MPQMPDGTPYPDDPGDLGDPIPGLPDDTMPLDPGGLYPGGNYPQTPYNAGGQEGLSDSRCCEDRICNCLGSSLQGIEYALYAINATLQGKKKGICDDIDNCLDKIIEGINKKYKGVHHTCEECRAMVEQGLSGTLEFALTCAACTTSECNTVCSLGDKSTEGGCCKGCGKEPCCCKDGVCVPCGPEEEKPKKYQGWCDRETGLVVVNKEGDPSPGGGFVPVSLADTEQVALEEANQYCSSYKPPEDTPQLPSPPSSGPSVNCDILNYCSPGGNLALFESGDGARALAAGASVMDYIRNITLGPASIGGIADLIRAVGQGVFNKQDWLIAQNYIPQIATLLGCGSQSFTEPAKIIAAIGIAERYSGANFQEFTLPYRYAMHAACRNVQLPLASAVSAYLANAFNYETLDCHAAINGFCPESVDWMLHAEKAKPVPLQLAVARRRELIDPAQYNAGMRQLGYIDQDSSDLLFNLTEQVPALSDIIRFMVRDTDDEGLVERFGLDSQFESKYRSQLKKWSTDQGIPEIVAKYAWRAHWGIPAPGQLFEFWHRLRKNPDFGGQDKLWEDIKAALVQQDILPYWHKHFEAVSFKPLGRVDIRRAFNIGAMSEDDLEPAYTQLGYSDETVAKLTKFSIRLRNETAESNKNVKLWLKFAIDRTEATQRMTDGGLPAGVVNRALDNASIGFINSPYAAAFVKGDLSRETLIQRLESQGVGLAMSQQIADLLAVKRTHHPALADYVAGITDRGQAWSQMTEDGMNGDVSERLLDGADRSFRQARVTNCQNAIKSRYLMGELDQQEATDELTTSGTTQERASSLLDWWGCERMKSGKTVTASILCDWLARGAIQAADFTRRLVNIGYTQEDSALMLEDCLIHINAKRLAEAKKEMKDQVAQQNRIARALAKANAAEQRQTAQIFRAQQAAAAARKNREKQLLSAASKIAAKCDCDIYDSRQLARETRDQVIAAYGLNQDEALQALILGVEQWDGGEPSTLAAVVDGFAADAATVTGEPAI